MQWREVRQLHPAQWLVIDAAAHRRYASCTVRNRIASWTRARPVDQTCSRASASCRNLPSESPPALKKEIDRLAKVIAITEEPPEALAAELDKRTKRLREVQGTLAARAAAPAAMVPVLERVEDRVRRHLADLRAALDADNCRAVIETLYREPLTMTPTADRRFEVAGVTHPGDLFRTSSDPSGN